MPWAGFAENLVRSIELLERRLGPMQLQVCIGEAKMGFSVVRLQLQCVLEVPGSLRRLLQIVEHKTAVHVPSRHLGVEFESPIEILQGSLQIAVVHIDLSCDKRQVLVCAEYRFVPGNQRQRLVVATEV